MKRGVFAGVFFISLSMLMLELTLTRIFSTIAWYHFAFMVVSLALFGIGASGVYIFARRDRYSRENLLGKATKYAALFAIFTVITFVVILNIPFDPKTFDLTNVFYLSVYYIISSIPFFFGGLIISLILTYYGEIAGKTYFFDLLGAGVGAFLTVLSLETLGLNTVLLIAPLGCLSSILFSFSNEKKDLIPASVIFVLLVGLLAANVYGNFIDMKMAKGKDLSSYGIVATRWNSISRVDVYTKEASPVWGTSPSYTGTMPKALGMMIDVSAYTPIINESDPNWPDALKHDVTNVHYYIADKPYVLIIGPGGGRDVLGALAFGSRHVKAVELNPLIVDLVKNKFSYVSGDVYNRSDVDITVDEGRSYIERNKEKFDVIQLSLVDTWAAVTSGAYTLSENFLYTKEAFNGYLEDLDENGTLSVTRWVDPPAQMLRLVGLGASALRDRGVADPSKHVVVIRSGAVANVMIKKSPFTAADVKKLKDVSNEMGFTVLYDPYSGSSGDIADLLKSGGSADFYASYYESKKLDVSPTTDDKPFFFYSLHFQDSFDVLKMVKGAQLTNIGIMILLVLLVLAAVLVTAFIFGPLMLTNRSGLGASNGALAYFAAIGIGFISVEIALMQKFILFLGHPMYALSVILFALLVFSGFGSYLTSKLQEERLKRTTLIFMAALIMLITFYAFSLDGIFSLFMADGIAVRIAIAILLLLPLGTLMGMPLPTAVRILSKHKSGLIAWCWGVNGATSVLGSIAAVIIAMNFGFSATLLTGMAAYVVAALSSRLL
jgi:hypothetical protein